MKAATTSDLRMMRLLLDAAPTRPHDAEPHDAADGGRRPELGRISSLGTEEESIEAMKLMLARGADVNAANDLGETALHGAAQRGADRVVQFLAEHGARLDAKTKRGRTPLDEAIGQANESDAAASGGPSARARRRC